jgi:hypothetical protein
MMELTKLPPKDPNRIAAQAKIVRFQSLVRGHLMRKQFKKLKFIHLI